jgi:hypothetical protein
MVICTGTVFGAPLPDGGPPLGPALGARSLVGPPGAAMVPAPGPASEAALSPGAPGGVDPVRVSAGPGEAGEDGPAPTEPVVQAASNVVASTAPAKPAARRAAVGCDGMGATAGLLTVGRLGLVGSV